MQVLGIDPGMSGAAVLIDGAGDVLEAKRDFRSKAQLAIGVYDLALEADRIVIELVHSMPGQGVCSMFSFGESFGAAQAALALADYNVDRTLNILFVDPAKWQNALRKIWWVPRPAEFDSRAIATRLQPARAGLFKRQMDHNTADAYLLARYGLLQTEKDFINADVTKIFGKLPKQPKRK